MVAHEHGCFSRRAGLAPEALAVHLMAEGPVDFDGIDLVFFGGSGNYSVLDDVLWIRRGLDALLQAVDQQIPAWASCFGFQGLALALGGEVNRDPSRVEMGAVWMTPTAKASGDPVFSVLPTQGFWAQQGHQDHVDGLPPGVTLLAQGDAIRNQAFKVDRAPFWASQFHPELTTPSTLDRFHRYAERYLEPAEREMQLDRISRGEDTPEVAQLLSGVCDVARDRR